ncbi:amino acid adenylation domain-containing protein [Micromonospora sp. NPDC000663]|uniref:amino acid adenylation domain-containing protein n=1 Tax=Micromonospora sp. NPDC000663 TaxID=3364218 RepID=UPI0036AD23F5
MSRLRGLQRDPLLQPGGASVPDPAAEHVPPAVVAALTTVTGDDPTGLNLLLVAATRLTLATFGAGDRLALVMPAADVTGPRGEILLCTRLAPRTPVADFLEDLYADLVASSPYAWQDRAALASSLDATGSIDGDVLSQLAVLWGDGQDGRALTGRVQVLVHGLPQTDGSLSIEVSGAHGRVPAAMAALPRCLATVLASMADNWQATAGHLDVLGPAMRADIERWSGLPAWESFPPRTLVELVEASAARHPDRPAVVDADHEWSYAQLYGRARRAAALLADRHGVGHGQRVAVLLPRGAHLVLSILAVLRAGAAYVPIDPGHPPERVSRLLTGCGATVVIGHDRTGSAHALRSVSIDELLAASDDWSAADEVELPEPPRPGDEAVVFFTSGSTGLPRPLALRHDQISHKAVSSVDHVGFDEEVRCALVFAISSDGTSYHIFVTLAAGGAVVSIGAPDELDPHTFWERVRRYRVTTINCSPGLLAAMLEVLPRDAGVPLRHLFLGGDAIPRGLMQRIQGRLRVDTFANLYGPSETTIEAISFICTGDRAVELASVPIGRPSPGYTAVVVGPGDTLAPVGVTGEIYLAGPAVADGYLDAPEATAERFVDCPVPGVGRSFRTGDLARWTGAGELEFLGRADNQVQLRGHRVEPGEVEQVMVTIPEIRQAVVSPRTDAHGNVTLSAWYTSETTLAPATVRGAVAALLPPHMVPAICRQVPALPLTPMGKIDRAALAALPLEAADGPWTPVDEADHRVAQAWEDVLGVPPRQADEDFFEAGGHSLTATQLVARLCSDASSEPLTVRQVFSARTPAALAAALRRGLAENRKPDVAVPTPPPGAADSGPRRAPASNAQRRMWLLEHLDDGEIRTYNVVEAYRLEQAIAPAALRTALAFLVERHEALRTGFATVPAADGTGLEQVVLPAAEAAVSLSIERLDSSPDSASRRAYQEELRFTFDLATGPLIRLRHLVPDGEPGVLLFTIHHAVTDGWSLAVIVRDLLAAARAAERNTVPALPAVLGYTRQSDLLTQRLSDQQRSHAAFWQEFLADLPDPVQVPADRLPPAKRSNEGGLVRVPLEPPVLVGVQALCRETGATAFHVGVAALRVLLYRITGAVDVPLGTVVAARNAPGLADEVGLFVNTVVLRTVLAPGDSFRTLLDETRRTALAVHDHEEYPFDRVVDELGRERAAGRNPLFDVLVSMELTEADTPDTTGAQRLPLQPPVSDFDLSVSYLLPDGALHGTGEVLLHYRTDQFDQPTVSRLAAQLAHLIAGLVEAPDVPVQHPAMLPPDQVSALLHGMNATAVPEKRTLLDLVAHRTATDPGRPAVRHGDVTLTYAELDSRSDALAQRLRELTLARPEHLVAVVAAPTVHLPVAMLAVLKTGAAILPLDPDQPADRLATLLTQAAAVGVLAGAEHAARLGGLAAVPVLDPAEAPPSPAGPANRCAVRPDNLAWAVVVPDAPAFRAVAVEHRQVVDGALQQIRHRGPEAGAVTLLGRPAHDGVGLAELFTTLAAGATVVMVASAHLSEPGALCREIRQQGVTHLSTSPEQFRRLQHHDGHALRGLERVVLGEVPTEAPLPAGAPEIELFREYVTVEYGLLLTPARVDDEAGAPALPLTNRLVDLLDAHGDLVAPGLPGEICVSGAGLARGYLSAGGLQTERFPRHPLRPGRRMYRTGTFGRWLPDGRLMIGPSTSSVPDSTATLAPPPTLPVPDDLLAVLRDIWTRALQREVRSVDADLFEVGGHSLTAIEIVGGIRTTLGVEVPLRVVFEHQTIARMAAHLATVPGIRQAPLSPAPAEHETVVEPFAPLVCGPATAAQRRIWLASRAGTATAFNVTSVVFLDRELHPDLLREALDAVVRRQQSLRIRFRFTGAELVQEDPGPAAESPLVRVELPTGTDPDDPIVATVAQQARQVVFDPARPPLFQVRHLRGVRGGDALVVTAHHLVWDRDSLGVLVDDLIEAYDQLLSGGPPLPTPAPGFLDWAEQRSTWLASPAADAALAYWRDLLAGPLPVLEIAGTASRPTRRPPAAGLVQGRLDPAETDALRSYAAEHRATMFMAVVTALTAVLHRRSGAVDLLVGFPLSVPERPRAVGCFVDESLLRLAPEPRFTRRDLLVQVRDRALAAYQHGQLPLDHLVTEIRPPRRPGRNVLFDVGVSWEGTYLDGGDRPGAGYRVRQYPPADPPVTADLRLYAREENRALVLELAYQPGLFDKALAAEIFADLTAELSALHIRPEGPLAEAADAREPAGVVAGDQWGATSFDF